MGHSYTLQSGYAYSSSRRYPVEPETIIVSEGQGKYIGLTVLDGQDYATFRDTQARKYYFQLCHACLTA